MPKTANMDNSPASNGADHEESHNSSLLDQAERLRDTLTEALTQPRDSITALRRQKKANPPRANDITVPAGDPVDRRLTAAI